MFRKADRDEELRRLEQELLEPEAEEEEEYLEQDALDEDGPIESAGVYRNFSNNYGTQLRNYASGYRTYNTDTTDTDPEALSRELLEPEEKESRAPLVFTLIAIVAALIMVICLFVKFGGLL